MGGNTIMTRAKSTKVATPTVVDAQSSSGNYSTAASSGDSSTAECDTNGFACIAGLAGRVRGNAGSAVSLGYTDTASKSRIAVGYIGEDGLLPGVWYRVDSAGKFIAEVA